MSVKFYQRKCWHFFFFAFKYKNKPSDSTDAVRSDRVTGFSEVIFTEAFTVSKKPTSNYAGASNPAYILSSCAFTAELHQTTLKSTYCVRVGRRRPSVPDC